MSPQSEANQLCTYRCKITRWHPHCRSQFHYNDVIYEPDDVSNHQRLECLLNRLFMRRSNKTSKLRVTGLCEGNPSVTGGSPSQRASNAENVSIWWRHHVIGPLFCITYPAPFSWRDSEWGKPPLNAILRWNRWPQSYSKWKKYYIKLLQYIMPPKLVAHRLL